MHLHPPTPTEPWHSPERAWAPVMWLIRVIAICLSMVLFAPLLHLVIP
jgi:hypothetical protein